MKDKNKNRKGYKETKVGWIPENWVNRSFGESFSIIMDGTHFSPKTGSGLRKYITSKNIRKGYLDLQNCSHISEKAHKEIYKKCPIRIGQILLTKDGASVGNACINPLEEEFSLLSSVAVLDGEAGTLINRYAIQWILSGKGQYGILSTVAGQAITRITLKAIAGVKIPLPPIPEQKAIASVLECWDKSIQKYEEKIEKKRNIKKGLMQKLLSGEQRLPGFDGEWNPVPLGDTADPKKRWSFTGGPFGSDLKSSSYTKDGIRIIQLQNIGDGAFHNDSKIYTSPEKADELISCNIFPGDLILSKMGDPVARACIIPDIEDRFLMCSDGIRLSVNENQFDPFFIYSVINAKVFRSKAHRSGTGSTRRRIGLTTLRVLSLYCPPLPEQKAIAAVLSSADSEIKTLKKKLALLHDQKKYLLNNLVTGTIRLPEFCKEVG